MELDHTAKQRNHDVWRHVIGERRYGDQRY